MSARPVFSVVVPLFNEEENIPVLLERLRSVMDQTGATWELVAVDDGSNDRTRELLEAEAATDWRLRILALARNFGHQIAVTAGLDHAAGEAVILMDGDLQDPPELILEMIERWRAGNEVVYAIRSEREGESRFKKLTALVFYRLIYHITDVDIPLDTGDFRLLDRKVVDALNAMREHNRFIRGMTSWVGFRQSGVRFERQARHAGETKYPLRKMLRFAMDAITGFSWFPLQIMIYFSLFLGILSVLAVPVISLLRVALGPGFLGGQVTTIVMLLLLSAFQLFFLFVMGQYVARIFDEVRQRPLYLVAQKTGFDSKDAGKGTTRVAAGATGAAQSPVEDTQESEEDG